MALILNGSDTSAGNDAGLGYTSAEGIIITGQGSTSDVTIKNDADATVLSIPTGTTNVGIGTTSPSEKLEVSGNVKLASDNPQVELSDTGAGGTIWRIANGPDGNGKLTFNDSNTERVTFLNDGKVGIGTNTPGSELGFPIGNDVEISQVATTAHQAGNAGHIALTIGDGGNHAGFFVNNTHDGTYSDQHLTFKTAEGGVSVATERMRITSDGRLLAGTTTSYGRLHSANISFNPANAAWLTGASFVSSGSFGGAYALLDGSAGYSMYCAESGSDFYIQHHSSTTAGSTGGVKLDNAATSWTSASDEREKENLVGITDATTKIKSLRTVIGNYTWQPDVKHAFLIAQDVQTVLPEAVSVVNKSATTDEQRLGIRYTEVIPLLTAALKESLEKIEALEARITALEAG